MQSARWASDVDADIILQGRRRPGAWTRYTVLQAAKPRGLKSGTQNGYMPPDTTMRPSGGVLARLPLLLLLRLPLPLLLLLLLIS